jgi:hypothetical protein
VASTTSLTTLLTANLLGAHAHLTAVSTLAVSGTTLGILAPMPSASAGTLVLQGALSMPTADVTVVSSGILPLAGSGQASSEGPILTGLARLSLTGASAMVGASMGLSASGSPPRVGTSSLTLASMHAMAQGA